MLQLTAEERAAIVRPRVGYRLAIFGGWLARLVNYDETEIYRTVGYETPNQAYYHLMLWAFENHIPLQIDDLSYCLQLWQRCGDDED